MGTPHKHFPPLFRHPGDEPSGDNPREENNGGQQRHGGDRGDAITPDLPAAPLAERHIERVGPEGSGSHLHRSRAASTQKPAQQLRTLRVHVDRKN